MRSLIKLLRPRYVFQCVLGLGLLGFSGIVLAAGACPSYIKADPNKISEDETILTKQYGVRFDERMRFYYDDQLYDAPAGYFQSWHGTKAKEWITHRQNLEWKRGVGFAFWMPSLRHVERSWTFTPSYQPCESGRPLPGEDEYVVKAIIQPMTLNQGVKITPARGFSNLLGRRKGRYQIEEVEFDLIRYTHKTNNTTSVHFRHLDGADLQVHLICTSLLNLKVSNPGCKGYVLRESDGLHFFFHFGRGFLPQWRAMADGVMTLFDEQWRVKADEAEQARCDYPSKDEEMMNHVRDKESMRSRS